MCSHSLRHLPEKQNTLYHCCVPLITEYSVLGSFLFCSKGSVLTLGRMSWEQLWAPGKAWLGLRAGLAWAGARLFCLISFVTLGTSPLLPHLHYLIKWGHCEIKWDVINRALLSTSLNRWWFSSLSLVLFYCFILYNMMGLTIQSSAVGEDPSCHCH